MTHLRPGHTAVNKELRRTDTAMLAAYISRSRVSIPLPGPATKQHVYTGNAPGLPTAPSIATYSSSAAGSSWWVLRRPRRSERILSYLDVCTSRLAPISSTWPTKPVLKTTFDGQQTYVHWNHVLLMQANCRSYALYSLCLMVLC